MKKRTERHQDGVALSNQPNGQTAHAGQDESSSDPLPGSVGTATQWATERNMVTPGLDLLTREYLLIAMCVALRHPASQLRVHVVSALKLGAPKEQIVEVIRHTISYGGAEVVAQALKTANEVIRARSAF